MPRAAQAALHDEDEQSDLFGKPDNRPPPYEPDPERVRARLVDLLAKLREVKKSPLEGAGLYRAIIPSLVKWLPEEEGAKYESELMRELKRLKADKAEKPKPRMTQAEYDALTI